VASTDLEQPDVLPWSVLVIAGTLSVVVGILAMVYPSISLGVLAVIAGLNVVVLSALLVGETLGEDEATDKTLRVVLGVLGIIAGIIVIRHPGDTVLVLVVALGIWIALDGLLHLIRVVAGPSGQRLTNLLGGLLQVALGVAILSLPDLSIATLAVLVGLSFVVRGGVVIVAGLQLRHAAARPASGPDGVGAAATTPATDH
jgi:uncharacterized membrane protein HdeD (DUF308 family)